MLIMRKRELQNKRKLIFKSSLNESKIENLHNEITYTSGNLYSVLSNYYSLLNLLALSFF